MTYEDMDKANSVHDCTLDDLPFGELCDEDDWLIDEFDSLYMDITDISDLLPVC